MTSLIYNTGTVSVSAGSAVVTGNMTGWAVALVTGGLFSCAGISIPIASVESDTSLTLAYPWTGADATGAAYAIARDTSEATRAAWTNDRLATIIQRLSLVGIHPDGSGTIAERDALDPVPAVGYLWLYAEAGNDLAIYRKTASGWDGPFDVRGDVGGTGGSGPAATIAVGDVTTVAPGDPATVTNSGTSSAAVFNFEIPQGAKGDLGPVGPAYESYAVSIYKADGIGAGGYYADRRANANSVQDTVYAEVIDGDVGVEIDLYLEVGGAMVYGPVTVAPGAPVTATGLAIPVAQAASVNWVVASVIGGAVRDLFAKSYGAHA